MRYDLRAARRAALSLAPVSAGGKGQLVTITSASGGSYNVATGVRSNQAAATQTGSGVEELYSTREVDGAEVLLSDRKFMLSPFAEDGTALTMPSPGDTLAYESGKVWRIVSVEVLAPAGLPIYATLQIRGV